MATDSRRSAATEERALYVWAKGVINGLYGTGWFKTGTTTTLLTAIRERFEQDNRLAEFEAVKHALEEYSCLKEWEASHSLCCLYCCKRPTCSPSSGTKSTKKESSKVSDALPCLVIPVGLIHADALPVHCADLPSWSASQGSQGGISLLHSSSPPLSQGNKAELSDPESNIALLWDKVVSIDFVRPLMLGSCDNCTFRRRRCLYSTSKL